MSLPTIESWQTFRYIKAGIYPQAEQSGKYIHQIALVVTNRCGARCIMCNSWKAKPEPEFTLSDLEQFLQASYLPRLDNFSLTGGDPYLREDLVEIARLIHKYYPQITFFVPTNGLNPEQTVDKAVAISAFAPITVCISMDGLYDLQDNIRGRPGTFSKMMETVEKLKQQKKIILNWSFTILPQNYRHIRQVYEFSKHYTEGINICFRPAGTGFYFNTTPADAILLSPEERREAIEQLEEINQEYKNLWVEYVIQFMKTGKKPISCGAGKYSCVIMPDFDVYPCTHSAQSWCLGNLRDYQYCLNKLLTCGRAQQILKTKVSGCNACVNEIEGFATIIIGLKKGLLSCLLADAKGLLSKFIK